MNKRYAMLFAASAFCALSSSSMVYGKDNKQLVQHHMDILDNELATLENAGKGITYEDRMRILSNLRRKFSHRKMRPYKTSNEEKIVRLISRSYEEIKNAPGNHTRAAEHYKEEATGRIALYTKAEKLRKAGVHPTTSEPTQPSMLTKASEMLGTLTGSNAGVGGQMKPSATPTGPTPKAKKVTPLQKSTSTSAKHSGKKKTFEERMDKKRKKKAKKKALKKEEENKVSKAKKAREKAKTTAHEKKPKKVAK